MTEISQEMLTLGRNAKEASKVLADASAKDKNQALYAMADALIEQQNEIIAANLEDQEIARENGLEEHMIERLALNEDRVAGMADGIRQIAAFPDPVAKTDAEWVIENGLRISKRRVPLGVVGIIYESRPNVTADASALCLKSGNATILRGGKEALNSNLAIEKALKDGLSKSTIPSEAIQVIPDSDRKYSNELMRMNGYLDCLIPRGSHGLIQAVVQNANVPVIQTGDGNDHLYIEKTADIEMAKNILVNAKTQRPSTCNTIETLVIDEKLAATHLSEILQPLKDLKVELRGDKKAQSLDADIQAATEDDWGEEYLALILAVRVVSSYEEAVEHINTYTTNHSEAIVTSDYQTAQDFMNDIDASSVYVNASTRFTDGEVFGFGGEIGISTQKLHARGPMGVEALTSYKYTIQGNGQIRE